MTIIKMRISVCAGMTMEITIAVALRIASIELLLCDVLGPMPELWETSARNFID